MCGTQVVLLQPLWWRCVECVIHHEQDVHKEQQYIYVAPTSNNTVIMACEIYCCLLPQCEPLRICHLGFPIATKWCCDQNVEVVPGSAFTKGTCVRCGSLWNEGMLLQSLRWLCIECVIHHERDVRREQQYIYVAPTSNSVKS